MKKLSKILVFLSIVTMIMSVTVFQMADDRKPVPTRKPIITKPPVLVLMYDIRGKWKIKFDWDSEPEAFNFDCTVNFSGTKTSGIITGVDSIGNPFNGTYKVNGFKITFQDNAPDNTPPSTSFPNLCKGKVKTKTTMRGTFKNGPDPGTWKAFRLLVLSTPLRKK